MGDQLESARFPALFESTLQEYEKNAGVKFAEHPLAFQLQNCDSIDSIIIVFQGQVHAFRGFQESIKVMESIKNTVPILSKISATTSLGDTVDLVTPLGADSCSTALTIFLQSFPPAKAILVGLAILLAVCASF
jgi:hypothetical protein